MRVIRSASEERHALYAGPWQRDLGQCEHRCLADGHQQRVDPLERGRRTPREQKFERFGQPVPRDRKQNERQRTADCKRRSPAEAVDGERGENAADGRSDGVARGIEAECDAAPALRCVLRDDHGDARDRAADTDAGEDAQHQQLHEAGGGCRCHHAERCDRDRQQHDRAPAEAVRPGRHGERADAHADEPGAQQIAELAVGEVPVRLDARCGKGHRQDVEPVEHVEADAHADRDQLESASTVLRPRVSASQLLMAASRQLEIVRTDYSATRGAPAVRSRRPLRPTTFAGGRAIPVRRRGSRASARVGRSGISACTRCSTSSSGPRLIRYS